MKQFVLSHRGKKSGHQSDGSDDDEDGSLLSMPNTFPARELTFIAKLAEDLNLNISWDEYDEDQNLVVWRFPSSTETRADEEESSEDEEEDDEEEEEDDEVDSDDEPRSTSRGHSGGASSIAAPVGRNPMVQQQMRGLSPSNSASEDFRDQQRPVRTLPQIPQRGRSPAGMCNSE